MDVARTPFVLTIAALFAGTALAAPPSTSTAEFAGQSSWSNTGPTAAPTITASPNNRYAYPQSTQPATGQQLQPTGNSIRYTAQQTLGTPGYPSQSTNPFAPAPALPAPNSTARGNLAPPPWPTGSTAPTNTTAPSWSSSLTPVTPLDRSVLTTPTTIQPNSGWSAIGTSIAAPPLLVPQLPASSTGFAPISTTPVDAGPMLTTDSYRGQKSTQSSFGNSSTPSTGQQGTIRSASAADDWASSWDGNSNNNPASFGRNANNSSRSDLGRDPNFAPSQSIATNPQDTGKAPAGWSTNSWTDNSNSWSQNSQSPPAGPAGSISASKPAVIGSGNNFAPGVQPPANSPVLGPPVIGSTGGNFAPNGTIPGGTQPSTMSTVSKPIQAGTTPAGEPQPWVTFVLVVLFLVGSLAANLYLGWSYLDARQKYQALVRRTADTFRRTKQPIAA